ncbi:50S ribosomal protein L28, apicoplast, putative [Plasmodium ovale curtisi]|uniref:Large ribosomal subunit protein bL28c n=1 Tax=Plasmodium ovale curtisi TaxID=864141 RepID=A0A1A8WPR7_PLAOA|nr:50S ribosomal protein L28, apicoplast, putative [Plasmodium ovale curtisi]SBS93320.1 50S ribosomal protein L28, apicoplast, putative [Plasmodium ovale curtisi]
MHRDKITHKSIKSLLKKSDMFKNNHIGKKPYVSKFSLYTKKRHKEALAKISNDGNFVVQKTSRNGWKAENKQGHYVASQRNQASSKEYTSLIFSFHPFSYHAELKKKKQKRCLILGKMDNRNARKISKSGVRTHRIQRVNLLRKRIYFEEEDRFVKIRVSARGLKTIKKYGLAYCCKKFNIDLSKKKYDAGYSPRKRKKKTEVETTTANNAVDAKQPQMYEEANKVMKNLNLNYQNK